MAKRVKAPAAPSKVQNTDDLVSALARLTELQAQRTSAIAEAEAQIAVLNQGLDILTATIDEEEKALAADVQRYAEVHRDELTDNGKRKTASFATGDIGWRNDPPSVSVPRDQAAQAAIIDALQAIDPQLVRTMRVIDKEAILALRSRADATPVASLASIQLGEALERVEAIPGLKIKTDVEKFFIKPAGTADQAEQAAADAEAVAA